MKNKEILSTVGDSKCPHCGAIIRNANPEATYIRCHDCYQYVDLEKNLIKARKVSKLGLLL